MPVANVSKRIKYFITNSGDGTVKVVDALLGAINETIPVGLLPRDIVATSENTIYVANDGSNTISLICDGVRKTFNIANNGIVAVDEITNRLYVGDTTSVTVNDADSGVQLFSIPTAFTNVRDVKLNHSKTRVFVLDDEGAVGKLKVFKAFNGEFIKEIPLGSSPAFILINNTDTLAYVSDDVDNIISVINLLTLTVKETFNNPTSQLNAPLGLEIDQLNEILFVANSGNARVLFLELETGVFIQQAIVGPTPTRLALTPDKTKLIVTNNGGTTISEVSVSDPVNVKNIPGFTAPYGVVVLQVGSPISPGDPIDLTDPYQLDDITESVCIITKKVFSSCQQRECFPNVEVEVADDCDCITSQKISFGNGFIVHGTEVRTPIKGRPNFSRVKFTLRVPFAIHYKCDGKEKVIKGFLEDIHKDVVLFIPETRSEFKFDIVVETRSELLPIGSKPILCGNTFIFTVGIFVVIKVVGEVQLLIPAFGYCPEPPDCEDFIEPLPPDLCEIFRDFDRTPFPEDFFPPQFEDLQCKI